MTITIPEGALWFIGGGISFIVVLFILGWIWGKKNLG